MDIKIPSVLSYTRKVGPTDGFLYATVWDERNTRTAQPLHLSETPRGDTCYLPPDCDTLLMKYIVKFVPGVEEPCNCTDTGFLEASKKLIKGYIDEYGFKELARRYAINIANARTLWRNRVDANKIEVVIKANDKAWMFDAKGLSIHNFDDTDAVSELADMIAAALSGQTEILLVEVEIYAHLGLEHEVYPSQEISFGRDRYKKHRILYARNGIAALHSQKIGNAIRTIDTWYPAYKTDEGVGPIAAEVYGAVTQIRKAFRAQDGYDFYSIFDAAVFKGSFPSAEKAHYAMAVLVRGGLFGMSNKV